MGWVTLDDGQHVYIGSGGEFQPRGPTAAAAGGGAPKFERVERNRYRDSSGQHWQVERAGRGNTGVLRVSQRDPHTMAEKNVFHVDTTGKPLPTDHPFYKNSVETGATNAPRAARAGWTPAHLEAVKAASKEHAAQSPPAGVKPADRVHAAGPGGMARGAPGSIADRMAKSADAARERATAARGRGDRPAELQAHEHRALILAKQNDFVGVHKSGVYNVAPAGEKSAAAALVARVRGGGTAKAPPAKPALPAIPPKIVAPEYVKPAKYVTMRAQAAASARAATIAKNKAADAANAGREDPAVRASRIQEAQSFKHGAAPAKAGGAVGHAAAAPAQAAAIGPKPGEKFALAQRSATGARGPENVGRGTTKFMFDMNRKDKPGQTSMFDKHEAAPGDSGMETQRQQLQAKFNASTAKPGRLF